MRWTLKYDCLVMIDSLKTFALSKSYAVLRKKGVACPECGESLNLPELMPSEDSLLQCEHCDWSGGVFEMAADRSEKLEIEEQPAGSKIIRSETDSGVSWLMPASKRPNFLCFFALLWIGFISAFTFGLLFGGLESDGESWVMLLFLVPFWGVGGGMAYWGLRMMLMESILMVEPDEVRLMQKLFGKIRFKSIKRSEVKRVELYKAYEQNKRPVYGLRIQSAGKVKLQFGARLEEREKRWLLGQLKQVLDPSKVSKNASAKAGNGYAGAKSLASYDVLDEIHEKGLVLKRVGGEGFRIECEYQRGKWILLVSLVCLAVSAVMLSDFIGSFELHRDELGLVDWIEMLIDAAPFVGGSIFGLVGLAGVLVGAHYLGRVKRFEFTSDELSVRCGKRHERGKKLSYSRDTFHSASRRESGHVNNEPRFSVSLKGRSKRVGVVTFVKRDVADQLESWLETWLAR